MAIKEYEKTFGRHPTSRFMQEANWFYPLSWNDDLKSYKSKHHVKITELEEGTLYRGAIMSVEYAWIGNDGVLRYWHGSLEREQEMFVKTMADKGMPFDEIFSFLEL